MKPREDDEVVTLPPPRRNGPPDRIDELNDAVKLLTSMIHRCIAASEAARDYSDKAVEASRESAGNIGELAREVSAMRTEVRFVRRDLTEQKTKIASIEKTLGRWPQGPDDTGSGIAGRVAMVSSHELEPDTKMSNPPPKALVLLWKRHRKLGRAIGIAVAVVFTAIQAYLLSRGGQ